jgi:DNA replication protein DnaC
MSYDGKLMRLAKEKYDADARQRENEFRLRRERVYAKLPRVAEIDAELRGTAAKIISSALRRGTDPKPAINVLRDRNLALQREKAELLTAAGYGADYLDDEPACKKCRDTGFVGTEMCECLRRYYAREQINELSKLINLGSQSFDSFDLDWYDGEVWEQQGTSPRENMEMIYEICLDYAHHFGPRSGNLFLSGAPGLGKTFLSACIAREVSENGFSVVYDTASHIFSQFESQKFGREVLDGGEGASEDIKRCLSCDLLIIDDLGTELTTPFVQSALYQIINSRLVSERKTIINSNLTSDELSRRYLPQIISRLEGEYKKLRFFGADIRRKKNKGL